MGFPIVYSDEVVTQQLTRKYRDSFHCRKPSVVEFRVVCHRSRLLIVNGSGQDVSWWMYEFFISVKASMFEKGS